MLNKLNEVREGLSQRFKEWKEEREAKRAQKALQHASEHTHGRFFLLHVPAIATICAAATEWYWAVLFCIEATGHIALDWMTQTGSDTTPAGAWHFALDIQSLAVLVGLVFATIPIVMLSMVWLPVQFAMRGAGRWRRGTVIFVGLLANILVIVSGTVVLNYNRQDQVREALVVEQTADANRAMLTANVEDLRGELDTLMNHRSTYVATAASVGAEAYERDYVRQARATNDPRLPLLERALGSARRADELRAEIRQARSVVATAAPAAASAANVEDTVGRELNTFAQYVEVWRPPFVAFICTLIGIFGAWWVLALIQGMNPRDVLRSGWADDKHRIEDLREEAPIVSKPWVRETQLRERDEKGNDEILCDADGTPLKEVKYLRRTDGKPLMKNQPSKVDVTPEPQPDETGVEYDGGSRTATSTQTDEVVPEADSHKGQAESEQHAENAQDSGEQEVTEPTHSEPSEELEELAFQDDELATDQLQEERDQEADEQNAKDEPEPKAVSVETNEVNHDEPREPETDPAKLIAAE